MIPDNTFLSFSIIALISTTVLLGFVLGVVIVSYRKLLGEFYQSQKTQLQSQQAVSGQAEMILAQARLKATDIINEARIVPDEEKQKILTEITNLTHAQEEVYQKAIEEIKLRTETIIAKMSSDVQGNIMRDFDTMLKNFNSQIQSSNTQIQNSFVAQYQKELSNATAEIEEYKKFISAEVDKKAIAILKDFSINVLSKVITPEDHQDIIIKALEEAKSKHAF